MWDVSCLAGNCDSLGDSALGGECTADIRLQPAVKPPAPFLLRVCHNKSATQACSVRGWAPASTGASVSEHALREAG